MECDLAKGDIIAFSNDNGDGAIWINIGEEDKDPIFFGNSYSGMGDFEVVVPEDGRYRIECTGRKAKGAIRFVISESENPPHL